MGEVSGKKLVVGVLAHVDAGKTTLIEALLHEAGAIRLRGRVDHGDAFLDTYAMERERGITIFSKPALLSWGDTLITLLDTPGHTDFSTEAERAISALDCAVLVISGSEGVQAHTETLWDLLDEAGVPTFVFVNKTDLAGFNRDGVLAEVKARLSQGCVDWGNRGTAAFFEEAALDDDAIEEFFATEALSDGTLERLVAQRLLHPVLFGSALRGEGVAALLDAVARTMPEQARDDEFAARVFKVTRDASDVRLAWLKVEGGALESKQVFEGNSPSGSWRDKVNQIRVYSGARFEVVPRATAGEVCAVAGLDHVGPGAVLGALSGAAEPVLHPALAYAVVLPEGVDAVAALPKLRVLGDEDPMLDVAFDEESREIRVSLMGKIQAEVFCEQARERFGLDITLGPGQVLYRETIREAVEGIGHFEPLRHYAEAHVLIEPLPRGSGLQFASACHVDDLDLNWQRLIWEHLVERAHKGVLVGAPITDVRLTVLAGRAHPKHTNGGDFRQATYRAIRQGLMQAESVLLEPWYEFSATVPAECVGRLLADITAFGGSFDAPEQEEGVCRVHGRVPASEVQEYAADVAAYTHGTGSMRLRMAGYAPCHNADEVIVARAYDPRADLANTPDSVFCAHGAGYVVAWDEVPAMAHVDSGWPDRALEYRYTI